MSDEHSRVFVERLQNLGAWELYRLVEDETFDVLCTVGMALNPARGAVDYGLWFTEEAEPDVTGVLELEQPEAPFTDDARGDALRQILYEHEKELEIAQGRLEFRISGPPAYDSDDGEADDPEG